MARRILTLASYLFGTLLVSLVGVIYFLLGLAFWRIFFDPGQGTPEIDYYILVIGIFGAALTFLVTLSVAGRAHRAANYPLLARLPSRVEHLTATLISAVLFSLLVQGLVALLALFRGPSFDLVRMFEIPPLWLSVNILAAVLALHASDLVAAGWSRVVVFGTLAILLFGQEIATANMTWLSTQFNRMGAWFMRMGWIGIGDLINAFARWLQSGGAESAGSILGIVFWPFHVISDAIVAGYFRPAQALAPALILLYATLLFVLAADLFATKDLYLHEE
jgi:hypothetical protein